MGGIFSKYPGFGKVVRRAIDIVLPPRCLSCGEPVATVGQLCGPCWTGAEFISEPYCRCCGLPLDYDVGPGAVCGECARRAPAFHQARSALRYEGTGRSLVLALKHGDRTETVPALAAWMVRTAGDLIEKGDLVVPVPLHRRRLFDRRFNQSALLAAEIGKLTGTEVGARTLVRRRPTPPQKGLSRQARFRNLQGAISVRDSDRARIVDRRAVLVDDVMTTGATAENCARTLLRAGCREVNVLTVTRVVRQDAGVI